jgi:hypothetical protein
MVWSDRDPTEEMKSCLFVALLAASSATAFTVRPTMSAGRRASTRVERRDVLSGFAGAAALVAGEIDLPQLCIMIDSDK